MRAVAEAVPGVRVMDEAEGTGQGVPSQVLAIDANGLRRKIVRDDVLEPAEIAAQLFEQQPELSQLILRIRHR